MTVFQQMVDCDGNQINLFTNQFYNIQNGGSDDKYLKVASDIVRLGSKSDASTQNNWYFTPGEGLNSQDAYVYYYLKSQDYGRYNTNKAYYLNYKDMPLVYADPVDHDVELTDITGDGSYWCLKKSGSGFNIVNKNSVTEWGMSCNYMNYANAGGEPIITYPQSGDIWTFTPVDYSVSANVQNIEYTGKTPKNTDTTSTFSSYPKGVSSSEMFLNNCNGDDEASETRKIGGSISHSVTVTHTETFTKGVSVAVKGGTGILEKIIADAKIQITGTLQWSTQTSKSSTATTTQSYELSNTLNVKPGEYASSVITYSFIPSYNAPFVTTSLVSVESQTSSGAKTVDNPNLIAELLERTGSTVIIKNKEYSDTQIEVQTRGVLSTNGAGGEFTVVNNGKLPCPKTEVEAEQPNQNHNDEL